MIKRIIRKLIFAVLILVALYKVTANSQTANAENKKFGDIYGEDPVNKASNNDGQSVNMSFSIFPNPFSVVSLIEFKLSEDRLVRITVSDKDGKVIAVPVDGYVESGDHHVYFKPSASMANGNYKCRMEVYSESNEILYSSERNIIYSKDGSPVKRK